MSALGESRRFFRYEEPKETKVIERCPVHLREDATRERLVDLLKANGNSVKCTPWQLSHHLFTTEIAAFNAICSLESGGCLDVMYVSDDVYRYTLLKEPPNRWNGKRKR